VPDACPHLAHGAILGQARQVVSGHLAKFNPERDDLVVSVATPEPPISREEVVAMLFNIADIASEAETIRRILEESGEEEEDQ
jgi:hypothetical protein